MRLTSPFLSLTAALLAITTTLTSAAPVRRSYPVRFHKRDVAGDIAILNYALTLEHLESTFYKQALAKFAAADFAAVGLDPAVRNVLVHIGTHEDEHVTTLTSVITSMNGTAVPVCTYKFPLDTIGDFLVAARMLENTGTSAYLGAAAGLNGTLLTAAATITTVEGRHSSTLNNIFKGMEVPYAFDTPLTSAQVVTIATNFIVACPYDLGVKPFTQLTLTLPPLMNVPAKMNPSMSMSMSKSGSATMSSGSATMSMSMSKSGSATMSSGSATMTGSASSTMASNKVSQTASSSASASKSSASSSSKVKPTASSSSSSTKPTYTKHASHSSSSSSSSKYKNSSSKDDDDDDKKKKRQVMPVVPSMAASSSSSSAANPSATGGSSASASVSGPASATTALPTFVPSPKATGSSSMASSSAKASSSMSSSSAKATGSSSSMASATGSSSMMSGTMSSPTATMSMPATPTTSPVAGAGIPIKVNFTPPAGRNGTHCQFMFSNQVVVSPIATCALPAAVTGYVYVVVTDSAVPLTLNDGGATIVAGPALAFVDPK